MRITRIRLSNFKPYAEVDVALEEGVTVIHGPNGSGKSSLLEACFFALYGSKALDGTLEDIVRNGTEETEIEVWFAHGGGEYHVERRIRSSGERAQTATCVLETPGGTIEGARDVRDAVSNLLRMDQEAFLNCAYVRQGEVNKLINATPGARQDMLDDLLQLGVLEDYRERAREARLGVNELLTGQRDVLSSIQEQIDEKEEKTLHARLNELETELAELDAEMEDFEENRVEAEETLAEAEETLDRGADLREEIGDLESDVAELTDAIAETQGERKELREENRDRRDELDTKREHRDDLLEESTLDAAQGEGIEAELDALAEEDDELRDRIQELQLEINDLTTEAETLREAADDLESEAAEARSSAGELDAEIEADEETIADRREKLDALDEQIDEQRAQFEDVPVAFGAAADLLERREGELSELEAEIGDVRTDLETTRTEIERAEELLAAGKCPECGQPVEGSPHVEGITADRERANDLEARLDELGSEHDTVQEAIERAEALRETERAVSRLEENRGNVEQLLTEKEGVIERKRERVEERRAEAAERDAEAAVKRDAATEADAEAETLREQIAEINGTRSDLSDRRDRLERLRECVEAIDEIEAEIERAREKRAMLEDRNADRRETLAEKRERLGDLQSQVDEDRLAEARAEKKRAADYLEQVEATLRELRGARDETQGEIGAVRNEIEELESLRERRGDLRERVDALESLHGETEAMEELYADLRGELRQQNLQSLERLLNETFDLVYQNDAYGRIELDANYELTVYQKDGEALDPEQLSGGERALFNLSLRTAIYRLLAEGIDGAAPMPPLILDEPTVFLDSGHVSKLADLIDAMRDLGVEQIVVVSHDDALVGAAETVLVVEKDPTTNRSRLDRAATVTA